MKLKIQFFVRVRKLIDPQPELLNVYFSQDELLSDLSESGNFLGDPLLVRKRKSYYFKSILFCCTLVHTLCR